MASLSADASTRLLDPDPILSTHDLFNPTSIFNVEDLVVVITGGGTGIGLIMATALENNGATVYIVGRRFEVVKRAAQENNKFGNLLPLQCDVTNRSDLLALVGTIKARHGYINLLINNAGIARNLYSHPLPSPEQQRGVQSASSSDSLSTCPSLPNIKTFQSALWNTGSIEDFAETFATNVTAVYYTTVAFLDLLHQGNVRQQLQCRATTGIAKLTSNPAMPPRPPHWASQVISVSSSGSFRLDAKILSPSYTLSKCACTHLGKLLGNLLAPWGIRSNVLAPGVWPTDMTTNPTTNVKLDPVVLADSVPLRRVGTPEDMAGAILFMASRAGAYVNGAVWLVDGGRIGTVPSSY